MTSNGIFQTTDAGPLAHTPSSLADASTGSPITWTGNEDTPWTEEQDEDEEESSNLPWWRGHPRKMKIAARGKRQRSRTVDYVPYTLKHISTQTDEKIPTTAEGVEFFPYGGQLRPEQTRGWKSWDKLETAAAYCFDNTFVVGYCTDDKQDCWKVIWKHSISVPEKEELYNITWSYNPFNLHPLIITGGRMRLIYIFDLAEGRLVRAMKGHGEQILSLAVCPSEPHILASASGDRTLRIWNIFGSDAEKPKDGEMPFEDYPMGDAEEGTKVVAIMRGGSPGGHRDEPQALAWHPVNCAIASGGRDYEFKIWPVPPLPPPILNEKPSSRSYRPILIDMPYFSTSRISSSIIDTICWLTYDILSIRSHEEITTFQWLGYHRYLDRESFDLPSKTIDFFEPDTDESHSFVILAKLPIDARRNYTRFGYHRRFVSHDPEIHPDIVQSHLIAMPIDSRTPEIILYNPGLSPALPKPRYDKRKRWDPDDPVMEAFEEVEEERRKRKEKRTEEAAMTQVKVISKTSKTVADGVNILQTSTTSTKTSTMLVEENSVTTQSQLIGYSSESDSCEENIEDDVDEGFDDDKNLNYEWSIKVDSKVWQKTTKYHKGKYNIALKAGEASFIRCVALSPWGAKWMIGVGNAQGLFIWRLKEF